MSADDALPSRGHESVSFVSLALARREHVSSGKSDFFFSQLLLSPAGGRFVKKGFVGKKQKPPTRRSRCKKHQKKRPSTFR